MERITNEDLKRMSHGQLIELWESLNDKIEAIDAQEYSQVAEQANNQLWSLLKT